MGWTPEDRRLFGLGRANKAQEQQTGAGAGQHTDAVGDFIQQFGIAPGEHLQDLQGAAEDDQSKGGKDDGAAVAQGRRRQSRQSEIGEKMQELVRGLNMRVDAASARPRRQ